MKHNAPFICIKCGKELINTSNYGWLCTNIDCKNTINYQIEEMKVSPAKINSDLADNSKSINSDCISEETRKMYREEFEKYAYEKGYIFPYSANLYANFLIGKIEALSNSDNNSKLPKDVETCLNKVLVMFDMYVPDNTPKRQEIIDLIEKTLDRYDV